MNEHYRPRRAFVLMPFSPELTSTYTDGIRAACIDTDVICERADEQVFNGNIVSQMYQQIIAADVIIAELTQPNRNVYFEVGYARAFGKRLVLLTANADNIPFDLTHYPHLVYGGDVAKLRAELANRLKLLLTQRGGALENTAVSFPWPPLLRRGMAGLDMLLRRYRYMRRSHFVRRFPELVHILGMRGARDIQVNLADGKRVLLFHDVPELIGKPAVHVGIGGDNIYDEVYRYRRGVVAWIDTIGNAADHPRVRTNVALFAALGMSGMRVVVEMHNELR